jgi:hypothetical protein
MLEAFLGAPYIVVVAGQNTRGDKHAVFDD